MQIRSKVIVLVAALAIGLTVIFSHRIFTNSVVSAAPPQAAISAKAASMAKSAPANESALSIPDTTSAINSPTPMSQRVVHYEIDAKYDATKHIIDATEVLTYHNLTGQPLDHFPFHLYQNAFQPNATWVREAKRDGRDRKSVV